MTDALASGVENVVVQAGARGTDGPTDSLSDGPSGIPHGHQRIRVDGIRDGRERQPQLLGGPRNGLAEPSSSPHDALAHLSEGPSDSSGSPHDALAHLSKGPTDASPSWHDHVHDCEDRTAEQALQRKSAHGPHHEGIAEVRHEEGNRGDRDAKYKHGALCQQRQRLSQVLPGEELQGRTLSDGAVVLLEGGNCRQEPRHIADPEGGSSQRHAWDDGQRQGQQDEASRCTSTGQCTNGHANADAVVHALVH
mmetsp:Transcript_50243/g.144535  ORF Transcript_50243/g.144535 Transcript_50243/m.144535 type:complete len:251 (-) Transcript_50243:472-1224(-)